jgi:hypothetical protein
MTYTRTLDIKKRGLNLLPTIEAVNRTERHLNEIATTRAERDSARRRAVEQVLLAYGLMKNTGDASHNFEAVEATE